MPIEYTITTRDHTRAMMLFCHPTRKQILILVLITLAIMGILAWIYQVITPIFSIIPLGGIAGMVMYIYIFVPLWAKWVYRNYKLIHNKYELTMNEEGLFYQDRQGFSTLKWTDYMRWRENKEYILLYLSPALFHIIPKRLSEAGLDLDFLKEKLQEHLGRST